MKVNPPQGTAEVDTLVVGAGAAGMTAALVSAIEGLDVLLCEKSSQVGGTSATSAGTIWVPGTRQSREAGFAHGLAEARQYLDAVIGPAPDNRRDIFLQTGPDVVDYLERHTDVKFAPYLRHPDYLPNRPARLDGGRAGAGAGAVRRPPAWPGFPSGAGADRRVHGARWNDDRPRRHRAAGAAICFD